MWREVPMTISTVLCGTAWEVLALYLYANGTLTNYFMTENTFNDIKNNPWSWFLIIACIPWWRHAHFFFAHRCMHPWNTKYFPDVG